MNQFLPSQFNILMVDDNPKNLQLLGATLRNEGYGLEFATNGQMALNWVAKKAFDLILLDIMMPGMSGYEVATILKKNTEFADIPIIYITAKNDKESLLHGFKTGACDYVSKPFDASELLARVRTHLELRFSKKQLQILNKTLEAKVDERTHELKNANEQLEAANAELLRLDKAKTEFLHIIAHEIRTPLNGIKGSLEIIKEFKQDDSLTNLLEILDISVDRLERFSINALKITQLRIGSYNFDMQKLSIAELINSVIKIVSNHQVEKQIKINTHLPQTDFFILADLKLLTQCIVTVCDNAIQFSPLAGVLTISVKNKVNIVELEICDQGPGFSEKALASLFKLFSPGEKHINENEGLELAMAQLIMEAHNGYIKVQNNDIGASVFIGIPQFE